LLAIAKFLLSFDSILTYDRQTNTPPAATWHFRIAELDSKSNTRRALGGVHVPSTSTKLFQRLTE